MRNTEKNIFLHYLNPKNKQSQADFTKLKFYSSGRGEDRMNLLQRHFYFAFIDKTTDVYTFFFKTRKIELQDLKKAYDDRRFVIENWKYRLLKDFCL